jgi:hypothetical protein
VRRAARNGHNAQRCEARDEPRVRDECGRLHLVVARQPEAQAAVLAAAP